MNCSSFPPSSDRAFRTGLLSVISGLTSIRATPFFVSIVQKMRALEQTWRDQEQRKFTEAFDQTAKGIGVFIDNSTQHVQMLNKKAALLEEYLKQR